jgi:general transcription factor 3C polypeptide 5 (transcription factor C subunit 1)
METHRESRSSAFYKIPPLHLVSVEHPAVVRNLDKAVATLQGNNGIDKVSRNSLIHSNHRRNIPHNT